MHDPEYNPADEAQPTQEEWEAYERDRAAEPPDQPSPDELEDMFRRQGEADPFRG